MKGGDMDTVFSSISIALFLAAMLVMELIGVYKEEQ
jgi:hypothetical membrane protein